MKKSEIKKTIGENRQRLYEATAILKLINHSEGFMPDDSAAYSASFAVFRIVDNVADELDRLDLALSKGVQS